MEPIKDAHPFIGYTDIDAGHEIKNQKLKIKTCPERSRRIVESPQGGDDILNFAFCILIFTFLTE